MTLDEMDDELQTCMKDWQGFLANPNWCRLNQTIAWPNYRPAIFGSITWSLLTALASERQYSFQFSDGSIIQMAYDFSNREQRLRKATLAYYENRPDLETLPAEDSEGEVVPLEDDAPPFLPRWLRLDFNAQAEGTRLHANCHLHIAGFPDTRVACSGVPGPRQFVEALVAWLYPDQYRETVLCTQKEEAKIRLIDVNRICLPVPSEDEHNSMLHLNLPRSVRFNPRA